METLKEQEQIAQPDAKQQAMERAQELLVDVDRMKEVLRAVSSEEQAGHIPPDAYQYYGRVQENLKEIAQLEEKYGFETALVTPPQAESIVRPVADVFSDIDGPQNNQGPQSAAEVMDAGSLLEFAKTQPFEFQSETTKSVEFGVMLPSEEMLTLTLDRPDYSSPIERARLDLEGGESQVIPAPEAIQLLSPEARRDWADNSAEFSMDLAQKAAEVVDVADTFARVAAAPGATFGVAEKLLAAHIDEQLRAGSTNINLTQSYLTEDPEAADARHTLALNNLAPHIATAILAGVTFEAGEAQLASEKLQEIIAIRNTEAVEGNGLSMGG
jgi:hypothetical protein